MIWISSIMIQKTREIQLFDDVFYGVRWLISVLQRYSCRLNAASNHTASRQIFVFFEEVLLSLFSTPVEILLDRHEY